MFFISSWHNLVTYLFLNHLSAREMGLLQTKIRLNPEAEGRVTVPSGIQLCGGGLSTKTKYQICQEENKEAIILVRIQLGKQITLGISSTARLNQENQVYRIVGKYERGRRQGSKVMCSSALRSRNCHRGTWLQPQKPKVGALLSFFPLFLFFKKRFTEISYMPCNSLT